MGKRDYSLDLIRVIACLMIVLMHSPMSGLGTSGFVLCGVSYFTAPGIGLFFMISGALLLKGNGGKPFETRYFLRRRFTKILIPLVFWTLLGWGLKQYGVNNTELSILWFMYCLAGMYLLTPILSRWLVSARVKEIEFYLLLWLVTLCVPFVKLLIPVNESDTSWLYYFHGYVGYLCVRILFTELFGAADISEKKMHVFICICVHFRYSANYTIDIERGSGFL